MVGEDPIEIADTERPEDEHRGPHPGLAELHAFLDIGARQHQAIACAGRRLERPGDLHSAMAIRVRLDDGDNARRSGRGAAGEVPLNDPIVGDETVQVDERVGRPDHGWFVQVPPFDGKARTARLATAERGSRGPRAVGAGAWCAAPSPQRRARRASRPRSGALGVPA